MSTEINSTGTSSPSSPQNNEPKKNNNSWIVPVLIVFLLIVGGFLIYSYLENKKLEEEKVAQEQIIDKAYQQLDSITNELSNKIITISQLGGEIDTLLALKKQLEDEKAAFRTRAYRQINDLQQKVDGYKQLLDLQDVEIKKLKEINEALMTENTTLKDEKNELNQSIRDLSDSKTELESKVALASRLAVENMKIFAVNANGREREGDFRNRQIDKIKISFQIAENKVAPIEGKEILVRVIAPDKNVLFDVTRGSGSFIFDGRELFYTAKQEILYDRKQQNVTFMYDRGSEYESGQYIIEVYTDDYKMGSGSFIVK